MTPGSFTAPFTLDFSCKGELFSELRKTGGG